MWGANCEATNDSVPKIVLERAGAITRVSVLHSAHSPEAFCKDGRDHGKAAKCHNILPPQLCLACRPPQHNIRSAARHKDKNQTRDERMHQYNENTYTECTSVVIRSH